MLVSNRKQLFENTYGQTSIHETTNGRNCQMYDINGRLLSWSDNSSDCVSGPLVYLMALIFQIYIMSNASNDLRIWQILAQYKKKIHICVSMRKLFNYSLPVIME